MKTQHLFEDNIYLISNHAVARNPLFISDYMQIFFKDKMEFYLSPICKIIAYSMKEHEFKILLQLKSRAEIESYYFKKYKDKKSIEIIPESTYIFSQVMANLQVSLVKHFNYKFDRSGTMMAGRFFRKLVESEKEMNMLIQELNNARNHHKYNGKWINNFMAGMKAMTSAWFYQENSVSNYKDGIYLNGYKMDLGGTFQNLAPYHLKKNNKPIQPQSNTLNQIFLE